MKKIILPLFIILYSLFPALPAGRFIPVRTYALTPTQPAEQISSSESQINKLKDRIASRVAELKLVERRGIIGTASEVSDTQLSLTDSQKNNRLVDVDELTKFSSPSAKGTFGISDIEKGNTLGILGLYNKQTRHLLARFVNILVLPKIIHGGVVSVDTDEFTVNVITDDKKHITVDIQTTTKTQTFTKENGLVRSGFSKIKEGQRIMIVGFEDSKDKNLLLASRVIVFSEIPVNPKIALPSSAPTQATESAKPKKE